MSTAVPLAPGQRERFLRAMGYRPLRLRGPAEPATTAAPPAPADAVPTQRAPLAAGAHGRAAAAGTIDPLLAALLAAAAATPADLERLGWEIPLRGPAFAFDGPRLHLNPIALRGDPAAKRALWKTLRTLRRRHLGSAR